MSEMKEAVIEVTIRLPYECPNTKDLSEIAYYLNDGCHCADNIVLELFDQFDKKDDLECFCDRMQAKFVKWVGDE